MAHEHHESSMLDSTIEDKLRTVEDTEDMEEELKTDLMKVNRKYRGQNET